MGVVVYEMEIVSVLPPAKLFKAFVLESDNLMPKVMPQAIKNVEILEGSGGPGTIKLVHFGEGSAYKCAKHKIDSIDKENFSYCYSIIEGDALGANIASISNEIKILPGADGGSVCKNISKYHVKGDAHLSEDEIKSGKEKASHMFKAVESYILANPDAC